MNPIRLGLETGYDHGRCGAWLLDWPGAFAWGATRAAALARVPSAASRFVDWLADHGESVVPLEAAEAEVVEEEMARTLEGGYEVNATFAADQRAVSAQELERHLDRLEFARADLVALTGRAERHLAGRGDLPLEERSLEALADGAAAGRDLDAVVRHLAGAETWFVSRLDPAARYAGPRDDLDAYLVGSRAFLIDGLRRLHAADAINARTDGKGEKWTLAKVLRRSLYHALDHLEELDRRLAIAERRVERVEIRHDAALDPAILRRLFIAAGLTRRARDNDAQTMAMLRGSTETVSAWDEGLLVGFARIISDEATNGYISTVAVAPRWQERGLGRRLMNELMTGREAIKLTLDARPGVEGFYERLGFASVDTVMVRPRGVS